MTVIRGRNHNRVNPVRTVVTGQAGTFLVAQIASEMLENVQCNVDVSECRALTQNGKGLR